MVGIPFSDPWFVHGDNKWVLYNTAIPESTLNKKRNSIAYHDVREVVATGEWHNGYEPMDTIVSDLSTKPTPGGERSTRIVRGVMYYILLDWLWVFTPWEFPMRMKRLLFFDVSAVGIDR